MKNSTPDQGPIVAIGVSVTDETLTIELSDGRRLSAPLSWFPSMVQGTEAERGDWELQGQGRGIHWPRVDEDISVNGLIAGHPSYESESSLQRWADTRRQTGTNETKT